MFSENLAETVLFSPISLGADSVNILSGTATPTMASWYLTSLHERRSKSPFASIHVNLIVGMASAEGISSSAHSEFQDLQRHVGMDDSWDVFHVAMSMTCPPSIPISMSGRGRANR